MIKKFNELNTSGRKPLSISDLIAHLQKIKDENGDLNCCISVDHEYWGSTESYLLGDSVYVSSASPEGPKSGTSEKCVVFSSFF